MNVQAAASAIGAVETESSLLVFARITASGACAHYTLAEVGHKPVPDDLYLASGLFPKGAVDRSSGRKKQNVSRILWLPFDFDLADWLGCPKSDLFAYPDHVLETYLAGLQIDVETVFETLALPIHRLDYTGYGLAAYVYLPEHNPNAVPHIQTLHKRIVDRINAMARGRLADPAVSDAGSRIMRLVPGRNTKGDIPRQSRTLYYRPGAVGQAQLEHAAGPIAPRPARAIPKTDDLIDRIVPDAAIDQIVAAVRPYWIQGKRHALALALAAMMAKANVPENQAAAVVAQLSDGDPETPDRLKAVATTYDRLRSDIAVRGYYAAADHLPAPLLAWLDAALNNIRQATAPRLTLAGRPIAGPSSPSPVRGGGSGWGTLPQATSVPPQSQKGTSVDQPGISIPGDDSEPAPPTNHLPPAPGTGEGLGVGAAGTGSTSGDRAESEGLGATPNQPIPNPRKAIDALGFTPAPIPPACLRGWINDYVRLASPLCEAPPIYHLASAIALIGATMGRTVYNRYVSKNTYANQYIMLVGAAGKSRKDTAIELALALPQRIAPGASTLNAPAYTTLTDVGSGQALVKSLAETPNILLYITEYQRLVRNARGQHSTIFPLLTTAWNTPPQLHNNSLGNPITANFPSLSILAAVQPGILAQEMQTEDIESGYATRWLYIPGIGSGELPDPPDIDDAVAAALYGQLLAIRRRYESTIGGHKLEFTPDAKARWNDWYRADRRLHSAGEDEESMRSRLGVHIRKVALVYAASEGAAAHITLDQLEAAIAFIEWCWDQTRQLMRTWGVSVWSQIETKIERILTDQGPMKRRPLQQAARGRKWSALEFKSVLQAMIANEQIVVDPTGLLAIGSDE